MDKCPTCGEPTKSIWDELLEEYEQQRLEEDYLFWRVVIKDE